MSLRTDDLIAAGSTRIGAPAQDDGGLPSTPFIAWPSEGPAWIEGRVTELWDGQYGRNATITVTACSLGLGGKEGAPFIVGGRANVGLSSASLRDTVDDTHVGGAVIHFAFLGWAESSQGNKYRRFTVLEVPDESPVPVAPSTDDKDDDDDKLPF